MISVLTPSRGRPQSLRTSADSIFATASRPDEIEFLVVLDPDEKFEGYKLAFQDPHPSYKIRIFLSPKRYGYRGMADYLNLLAESATGDWLLNWNDDATMLTEAWDDTLRAMDPNIMVAGLQDNYPGYGMVCFPAVRRVAVDLLGKFCEDTPHVDTWWQDIGTKSNTLEIVDVHVKHDRFDLTGGHMDTTWTEGRSGLRSNEFYGPRIQGLLQNAADKIQELR